MARNGFGEFLIARRAELRPLDVGLPGGGRRRTPGLRREEVAVRAGVSADYLARLEQGRDTNPSVAVIEALADALLLRGEDRQYFNMLALASGNESRCNRCPGSESADEQVAATIETILQALQPTPAFVVGRKLNVLGWNQAWADFVAPLGLLDGPDQPNLAWFTFMHPAARRVLRNWEHAADTFTAALCRAKLLRPGDVSLREMIETLRELPDFADRWKPHRVGASSSGTLQLDHPVHGLVEVPFETLEADRDQSVVVWLTDRASMHAPGLRLVPNRAVNQ
ncbi:helix-turn-helix domain-containing protein [Nocardia amamiensis]|uniref:helix-turn-helix domain-containing protein n=1 Tax=Nocardia amamiensis TaxID=404578 RepID=UPI0008365341|nr:helix-turn-helix transcriptional regulator [Nocardia amamiensis]